MNRINWSARRRVRLRGLLPALVLLSIAGCSSRFEESAAPQGVIVINVSGLRSDFAAASWADSSVSHHLSSFLEGALVYERAFAVSSDPLAAQVSLLSGLYPQEHGVVPPESALTSEAPVMAERFADSGYRTAAFTAGGYASPSFGIDRGFDEFGIPVAPGDGATPVFSSGLDFLRRVGFGGWCFVEGVDTIYSSCPMGQQREQNRVLPHQLPQRAAVSSGRLGRA